MTETKSGRDLKPEIGHKASPAMRRFFARFGITSGVEDERED